MKHENCAEEDYKEHLYDKQGVWTLCNGSYMLGGHFCSLGHCLFRERSISLLSLTISKDYVGLENEKGTDELLNETSANNSHQETVDYFSKGYIFINTKNNKWTESWRSYATNYNEDIGNLFRTRATIKQCEETQKFTWRRGWWIRWGVTDWRKIVEFWWG